MFSKSASYYDMLYSFKDYAAEADKVRSAIDAAKQSAGCRLLDVACGTGQHLRHLEQHFDAEGLDLDPELLALARAFRLRPRKFSMSRLRRACVTYGAIARLALTSRRGQVQEFVAWQRSIADLLGSLLWPRFRLV